MQFLPIEAIRPGQTLAAGVCSDAGAVLLPAGYCLTEGSIARLRSAGVTQVPVTLPVSDVEALDARIHRLEQRFQGVQDTTLLHLKEIVYQFFCRQKLEAQGKLT